MTLGIRRMALENSERFVKLPRITRSEYGGHRSSTRSKFIICKANERLGVGFIVHVERNQGEMAGA